MRVETYSDCYLDDVVRIVENFHRESIGEYDALFDANSLIETIKHEAVNNSGNGYLLIVDEVCQGIIFGVKVKSLTNGKTMFQEIIWYVNEPFRRYGVILLRHVEKILKSEGIGIMIMAVMENSKAEKIKAFYERLGFKKMETHYVRSL